MKKAIAILLIAYTVVQFWGGLNNKPMDVYESTVFVSDGNVLFL